MCHNTNLTRFKELNHSILWTQWIKLKIDNRKVTENSPNQIICGWKDNLKKYIWTEWNIYELNENKKTIYQSCGTQIQKYWGGTVEY